jgi:prephenate dehydrogenase
MTLATAVVLGGLGQVGDLIARALAGTGTDILFVDVLPRPAAIAPERYLQADITQPDNILRQAIARADCVVMSLPERAALASSVSILEAMSAGALWIDVLSVKQEICRILSEYGERLEIVSLHPMFAPSLGFAGQSVAFIEISGGPKSQHLTQILRARGAMIEMLTPEAHDKLTAAIQVATHAAILSFGAVLLELAYDAEKGLAIATPPHLVLLSLLERIVTANPTVYWDIQHYHPDAVAIRAGLMRAVSALDYAACADVPNDFQNLSERIRRLLISRQDVLQEMSDRIISEAVRRPLAPE